MKTSTIFIAKQLKAMSEILESEIRDYSGEGRVFIKYGKRKFYKMYDLEEQFVKHAVLLDMTIKFFPQKKEVLVQKSNLESQ